MISCPRFSLASYFLVVSCLRRQSALHATPVTIIGTRFRVVFNSDTTHCNTNQNGSQQPSHPLQHQSECYSTRATLVAAPGRMVRTTDTLIATPSRMPLHYNHSCYSIDQHGSHNGQTVSNNNN